MPCGMGEGLKVELKDVTLHKHDRHMLNSSQRPHSSTCLLSTPVFPRVARCPTSKKKAAAVRSTFPRRT